MLSSSVCGESIDKTTDESIALAAIDDTDCFGELYDRYVDRVFRYCAVRLGDTEAAQDATSLVFTKALAGRTGFRGGLYAAWLFRIAHNVIVDLQRSQRAHFSLDRADQIADPGESPETAAIRNDEALRLHRMLVHLSDDQRAVIELRLAGLNGNEIAAVLNMRRNTVDVLARRSVMKLRAVMTASDESGIRP